MQLGRNAQVEFAREISFGLNAFFLAHIQKYLQRLFELGAQLLGVFAVKICAAVEPENLPAKQVKLFVVFELGVKAVNCHGVHGSTPCCSSHLRMLATAPLSVMGDGLDPNRT